MIAGVSAAVLMLVPAHAGTSAARPPVSLVAAPSRVTLAGNARQAVTVTNSGSRAVVIDVTRAGYALDLRGRPLIVPPRGSRPAAPWLTVRPLRLTLTPGSSAELTVSARLSLRTEPGDHGALVLLTTRPVRSAAVAVRMRLGVVVVVRAAGVIVHRLELLRLRVRPPGRPRIVELLLANRGNVTELLDPRCLRVTVRRAGVPLAVLRPTMRRLLPRTRGIVELRPLRPARGWATVQVEPSGRVPCGLGLRRTQRVRL